MTEKLILLCRLSLGSGGIAGASSHPWLRKDADLVYKSDPDVFILLRGGVRLMLVFCVKHMLSSRVCVCQRGIAAGWLSWLVCVLMPT